MKKEHSILSQKNRKRYKASKREASLIKSAGKPDKSAKINRHWDLANRLEHRNIK